MSNPTLTLAISKEMKNQLNKYPEINWSEETRKFLNNKLESLKLTKKIETLIENNKNNAKTIDEALQKLLNEGKLNLSNNFNDLEEQKQASLKKLYKNEDDMAWKEIMKKNSYKKK
ncbi:MAG TPA: hypothetical protein PKK60_04155 [archaeon]|jgi:hypothetical protein|nr:hypothetical protein [archaeon]